MVGAELSISPSVAGDSFVEVRKLSAFQDPKLLEAQNDFTLPFPYESDGVPAMKLLWKEYTGAAEPDMDWEELASEFKTSYPYTFDHYVNKTCIPRRKLLDYQMRKHSDAFRRFKKKIIFFRCYLEVFIV